MYANQIHGYDYDNSKIEPSPVTLEEFEQLKITAGWTSDDETALHLAGKVLSDQTKAIVDHWRSRIIAGIPHLARHSKSPEGEALPEYAANGGARFEQWILDTCLRAYDQEWLNYQHEICPSAHAAEEEPDRRSSVDRICAIWAYHCLSPSNERNDQVVPRGTGPFPYCGGNASCLDEISAASTGAMGETVFGPVFDRESVVDCACDAA